MSILEDVILEEKEKRRFDKNTAIVCSAMDKIEQMPVDAMRDCFGTDSVDELFTIGRFSLIEKIYEAYEKRNKEEPTKSMLKFGDVVELVNVLATNVTGIVLDYDSEIKEYGIMIKSPEENRPEWGPLAIVYVPRKHIVKSEGYITSITQSIINWLKGMKK